MSKTNKYDKDKKQINSLINKNLRQMAQIAQL